MAEASKSDDQSTPKLRILRPFLHDISSFLTKNQMNFVYDSSNY